MIRGIRKSYWVIAFQVILSACCHIKKSNNPNQALNFGCDKNLSKYISEVWNKKAEILCYPLDSMSISMAFKYKTCFVGLSDTQTVQILGTPNTKELGRIQYTLSSDCKNYEKSIKYFLIFYTNSNKRINDVLLHGESQIRE
jgi:hypothetical protein